MLKEVLLLIDTLVVGDLQTNCYIVADETTGEAAIIDPGADADVILDTINRRKLTVKLVINTHGHFDHIMANKEVVEATGAPLAVHSADAVMLTNPLRSFSVLAGRLSPSLPASVDLSDGAVLEIGSIRLSVLHTPGHSPGSISLWCAEEKVVFSGDALFCLGIGRTDFPGGNGNTLLQSIRQRLFTLPDETVVYSGHGPQTTIGYERANNPWLA
jgi:glyoxylase-like metal-dependent hydrolase (beta-lactamase superfamily II)